jgi:hypothetical protein
MDVIVTVRFRVPNLYDARDLEVEQGKTPADFVKSWLADGYDLRKQEEFEVVSVEPAPSK